MDQASATFKGLTADVRKVSHTEVVNIDAVDSGTILVKRVKPHDTRIRIDLTNPRRETVTIGGGKVQIFYPQTNEAQEVDLGKNRGVVDQFMLLGFGSNSTELKNAYSVTFGGVDSVNGRKGYADRAGAEGPGDSRQGQEMRTLDFRKRVDRTAEVYTGGGDYLLSTYSRMKFNPSIADAALKLELPKGVKFGKLK